jgi:hypothetical protein
MQSADDQPSKPETACRSRWTISKLHRHVSRLRCCELRWSGSTWGAANAVAMLSAEARQRGVWTISAGNAGQGVAYAARAAGVPCKIVVIDTAPQTKIDRMRALGAELVLTPFDQCWRALEDHAFPGMDGTLVHPFDDYDFIAGHGRMALEILEDCPDVRSVVCAMGGGAERAGRRWTDRVRRRWRQRGPEEVRRAGRLLIASSNGGGLRLTLRQALPGRCASGRGSPGQAPAKHP